MGVVSGVAVFIIVWWVVLFTVLPWGSRPPEETEPGMADSAPVRPRLKLKFLVTTGIAVAIWLVVFAVVESDLISFREMAKEMVR